MDLFEFLFTIFVLIPTGIILWKIAIMKTPEVMELFTKKRGKKCRE